MSPKRFSATLAALVLLVGFLPSLANARPQLPENTDEEARLMLERGRSLAEEGKPTEALPFYEQALDMAEVRLQEGSPVLAYLLHELGGVYLAAGQVVPAEAQLTRALGLLEASFGAAHRELLPVLADLASLKASQGRAAEAEVLYRRTLEVLERERLPGDPEIARALGQLALLADEQGREDEAETLYRRSVTLADQGGEESPELASTLNNLASLYHRRGRYGDAEILYRRALDVRERLLGPNHWLVAVSRSDLGLVLARQNRLTEALDQATRASATLEPYCSGLTAEDPSERRSARELCRDTEALRSRLQQRLAGERPPEPVRAVAPPTPSDEPSPQAVEMVPGAVIFRAQVAARDNRTTARDEAEQIRRSHAGVLEGHPLHIEAADLGAKGIWYRIQFGAFTEKAEARALCNALRDAGWTDCWVASSAG